MLNFRLKEDTKKIISKDVGVSFDKIKKKHLKGYTDGVDGKYFKMKDLNLSPELEKQLRSNFRRKVKKVKFKKKIINFIERILNRLLDFILRI